MTIKTLLRKIKLVDSINATIKSELMRAQLKKLEHQFASKNKWATEKTNFGIKLSHTLWIGGNYNQDHSGFLQALNRITELTTFTQENGTYGLIKQNSASKKIIFDVIREEHQKQILKIIDSSNCHLVMGQMWASTISPELLNKIRSRGIKVINIAMDDKLPYHWQIDQMGRRNGAIGLADAVDLTLNTTRMAAEWYNKLGHPCLYWPLAGNPEVFYPRPIKKYDVVFIGSKYGYRGEIVESLIKAGIKVDAFGPGWPAGPCTAEESADIFGSAKIVLGIGYIGHSKKIVTLKQRDFDALFTGALYITSRNPDLEEILIDKQHVVYYDNKQDLIEKVKYYLKHDEERIAIAHNAMHQGLAKHTWDIRLRETFQQIGITTVKDMEEVCER